MSESEEENSGGGGGVVITREWPVTEEWLNTILKKQHNEDDIHIIKFQVKPGCDTGESVLSDILSVDVHYKHQDNEKTLNFIIKLLPQDPFSRFFVTEAQFDLREIKFYTEVVPDLETGHKPLPIPHCYHALYTAGDITIEPPRPPESVLVLENLKPSGYVCADFSRGLTLRQSSAAIEAISLLHALSLAVKKRGTILTERYPFLFQTTRASDSYQQLVERGLPQLSQFLERRHGLEGVLNALNDLRPHTKEIIENLLAAEEPMALITHTDFWCNNLMFKEEGGSNGDGCKCAILDWQMVTYSRPTNDLALLLISSVPAELRRLHTGKLLDLYWEKLTSTCQKLNLNVEEELGYDRIRLEEDYKKSQLLALLLCIGSVDLALGNAEMEERLLALLQDLYEEGLLKADIA